MRFDELTSILMTRLLTNNLRKLPIVLVDLLPYFIDVVLMIVLSGVVAVRSVMIVGRRESIVQTLVYPIFLGIFGVAFAIIYAVLFFFGDNRFG